jgi:hypothetical protein
MIDLLSALFDRTPSRIIVVSSYDNSVTYANPTVLRVHGETRLHPDELIGEDFCSLMEQWGVPKEHGPMLRLLDEPETLQYNRIPDGYDPPGWWVASAVPCADSADKPELLSSAHATESVALAIAEHKVLTSRVAIAMEYARCRRLQEAALAAIMDSNRRLDWVGNLLIDAGSRPLNPRLEDMPSLRDGVHDDHPQPLGNL